MNRVIRFRALWACCLFILLGADLAGAAESLPPQMVRMLPDQADVLLVVPSLDEADRVWTDALRLGEEFMEEQDEPMPGLDQLLAMIPAPYNEAIDRTRPLALAVTVPNPMAGGEPAYHGVIPVRDTDADFQGLGQLVNMPTVVHRDGYLLISSNPAFVEGSGPVRLLQRLPTGTLRLCLDLQNLWVKFGPMLDFGLAMAAQQQAVGPDGEPAEPSMSQQQTQATAKMLRDLFTSADVVSVGLDLRNDSLKLVEEMTVLEGSVLVPVPQPDFAPALALSGLLPTDADWVGAYGMDLTGILDVYKDFYRVTLTEQMAALGEGQEGPVEAALEAYFQAMDQVKAPTAMALNLDGDRLDLLQAMQTDDARAYLDLQNELLGQLSAAVPYLQVSPAETRKVAGLEVTGWDFRWDAEALLQMAGPAAAAGDSESREALTAVTGMLQDMVPGVRMAARKDLVFISMGREADLLKEMIERSKSRRGAPHPELARLAGISGPHCQGVFAGDLASLLTMIFEVVEEATGEDLPALDLDPMPATEIIRIGELEYAVEYELALAGMGKFIAAMEQMEDKEGK